MESSDTVKYMPVCQNIKEVMNLSLEKWTLSWNTTQESPLKWENLTTTDDDETEQFTKNVSVWSTKEDLINSLFLQVWKIVLGNKAFPDSDSDSDTQRLCDTLEARLPLSERRWKQNPFCTLMAPLSSFSVSDVWQHNVFVRALKEMLRLYLKG